MVHDNGSARTARLLHVWQAGHGPTMVQAATRTPTTPRGRSLEKRSLTIQDWFAVHRCVCSCSPEMSSCYSVTTHTLFNGRVSQQDMYFCSQMRSQEIRKIENSGLGSRWSRQPIASIRPVDKLTAVSEPIPQLHTQNIMGAWLLSRR